jgi:hypothetical protein
VLLTRTASRTKAPGDPPGAFCFRESFWIPLWQGLT